MLLVRVFGCMVASRGGYRMARGWHYAKLSLSNAPRLSFSDLCILLFLFLSLCRFLCVCVFLLLSFELGRCSSDLFLSSRPRTDWQPRVLLGMVEARSVNVKKTTSNITIVLYCIVLYTDKLSTTIYLIKNYIIFGWFWLWYVLQ